MATTVRSIITRAYRKSGIVASGRTPTSNELSDALDVYNQMISGWMGDIIGPRLVPVSMTAAVTGEVGGLYQCNTTSSALTLTLPAGPRDGARIGIADSQLKFNTNNATVNPNGQLIEGARANQVLSVAADNRRWWFDEEAGNWVKEVDAAIDDNFAFSPVIVEATIAKLSARLADEFGAGVTEVLKAGADQGHHVILNRYGWGGRNSERPPTGQNTPNMTQRVPAI